MISSKKNPIKKAVKKRANPKKSQARKTPAIKTRINTSRKIAGNISPSSSEKHSQILKRAGNGVVTRRRTSKNHAKIISPKRTSNLAVKHVFLLFVLLCSLFTTIAQTHDLGGIPTITLEKFSVFTNESLRVSISNPLLESTDTRGFILRISGPETLRYATPLIPLNFAPNSNGTYTFQLYNSLTGDIYDTKTLRVNTPPVVEALPSQAFSNRFIVLEKNSYGLGELVPITINYKSPEFSLRIVSPSTTYKLLGEISKSTQFTPKELGEYELQIVAPQGIVERKKFIVTPETTIEYKNLPFTNIKNNIRNHKNEVYTSDKISIFEQGKNIQSNIAPHKRYEVKFAISDHPVKEVSFKDVRFTNELDVGIETLLPKYNPAGRGSSLAAFAIDPSRVDFTNGTIEVVSPGTEIYKCKDYNFTTQECFGTHELIMKTYPGEVVYIPIDPVDPLFTFVDNTLSCSCTDTQSPSANSGTVSCNTYCAVTIDAPGATADTGFIEQMDFNVTLTINGDGATVSAPYHSGYFDHDNSDPTDGDEQQIGTDAATTSSTTFTWSASGFPATGSDSFNSVDCNNWPTNCTNYYVYVNTTFDFQAPGKSKKVPSVTIALDAFAATWNYTTLGDLSVTLNQPLFGAEQANRTTIFDYTPLTTATSITNCSAYTNDTSWEGVNSSSSITNNASNTLGYTYSADGNYLWNVFCVDSDSNEAFSSTNFTLTIDTVSPNITLFQPVNLSVESGSIVVFAYNVTDLLTSIDNCSLYANESLIETDTSITAGANSTFTSAFSNGDHAWYVSCYDGAGNVGQSETRIFTMNRTPTFWSNRFYESEEYNCNATGSCEIDLEPTTDGSINTKAFTIAGGDVLATIVNATSDYLGGNGVYIPSGQTVTFRADFSAYSSGTPFVTWRAFALYANGTQELICIHGDDSSGGQRIQSVGFEEGTCTPSTSFTLSGSDRVRMEMTIFNDHPSQTTTITHDYDDADSYLDFEVFQTIGSLSATLVQPAANITIDQAGNATMICGITCENGYCIDTQVFAQYRAVGASTWSTIGASGNLTLDTGETNPHTLGNMSANLTNTTNETFLLIGNQTSNNEVRCLATSLFENASTTNIKRILVGDSDAPVVSLVQPDEASYFNVQAINFTYNVTDSGALANCSIYLDDTLNQTNSTPPPLSQDNNFSISGIAEGDHNWTVVCVDSGGFQGNASEVRNFSVDITDPNVTLNLPVDLALINFDTVEFNWTTTDNRAENVSCDLTVDGSTNQSSISTIPGTPKTTNVSGFATGVHSWAVTCTDLSGNSNTSVTRTFTITNTPPEVSLFSPANYAYTGNSTVILTYNATDNVALTSCNLFVNGSLNQTDNSPSQGLNSFNYIPAVDGLHNWTVSCSDGSLETFASERNFTVDTLDPSLLIISPIETELTSATVPFQFNYTDATSPNGTCDIQYNTSTTTSFITGIFALSGVATTENEAGVGDGEYSWNATCTDLGDNTNSSAQEIFNVSVVPSITLNSPAANAFANGASVDFNFTPSDNDGFTNCTLRLLTGPNVSDTGNQSPITGGAINSITLTDLGSGAHTWAVACLDNGTFANSFQTSARFLFIDNIAPNATLIFPVDDVVNSSSVNFNWSTDDDQDLTLSCDLYVNNVLNLSSIAASTGAATNQTIPGFANGQHNWSVTCSDDAGNTNVSTTELFNVTVPPIVNLTDPEDNEFFNDTIGFTFGYIPSANDALANCTLFIDGIENETNTTPVSDVSNYFILNFPTSEEGQHDWNVVCTDIGGISGTATNNRTYYIDLTPANITLHTPLADATESSNNVSFSFTPDDALSPNVTCNLTVDGFEERENVVVTSGEQYNTTLLFPDGLYPWYVTCVDLAGNFNTSESRNFTVFAPPNVTALTPVNNTVTNSSSVTLTYYLEDGFAVPECNLTVNGAYNQTDASPDFNANNTFALTSLSEGEYNWSVSCIDSDANIGNSSTLTFLVDLFSPAVTLYNPVDTELFTVADVTFNFTANDTLDTNVTCNLTIDAIANVTDISVLNAQPTLQAISGFTDALHLWNVTCVDDATRSNTSETRSFNISVIPDVNLSTPANATWTNQSTLTFNFSVSDNDGFNQCILQIDGANSTVNATITNNQNNTIINSTLAEGLYNWSVTCIDSGTWANQFTPGNRTLFVDRTAPNITLYNPADGDTITPNVTFNYSIIEALSPQANCSIFLDGPNITFAAVNDSIIITHNETVASGIHYWNVTCVDYAGNLGSSATRNFTIVSPDLTINTGNITFSNSSAVEGDSVVLYANVHNIDQGAALNFTVQFYLGDPDLGGVQIGADQNVSSLAPGANMTVNVTHTAVIGDNNIFVLVDVPLVSNGQVAETNESNNKANNSFTVGHYEIFSGTTNDELHIDDSSLTSLFTWVVENITQGTLFVADSDSSVDFTNLSALGRDTSGTYRVDDFAELDTQLGSSNYADSINATYLSAGTPLVERSYTIFGSDITQVPVVNSTNTSSFQTGILWDVSDGGSEYDASQDVLFIGAINQSQVGFYGTYDYELKIPATLRDYVAGGGLVSFYAEIQ